MKVKTVYKNWITVEDYRLSATPYHSLAFESRRVLSLLNTTPLNKLTKQGKRSIFSGPRFARSYVVSPEHGVPMLSGSDILQADLSTTPLISRRLAEAMPEMILENETVLVTSHGTVGRIAYVRPDMQGMMASDNIMKVILDEEKILPGYVYAFLQSRFGSPMVTIGATGGTVQFLPPDRLYDLPVPRLGDAVEQRAHALVEEAAQARTRAITLLEDAEQELFVSLNMPLPQDERSYSRPLCSSTFASLMQNRADAFYYSQPNMEARIAFDDANGDSVALQDVADVFIPGIFKRLYADDPQYGYPYITGADVFQLAPTSDRYLMRKVAEEYRLVLHKGMILIQEAGQLGGLIGRSVPVGDYLDGFACTNNMVRVTPLESEDAGYIYAILANDFGIRLIARESAGSSIPHIEVSRVRQLKIPWPDTNTRMKIGKLVIEARELRDKACVCDVEARTLVEQAIEEAA